MKNMKFNKWVLASAVIGSGLILSACGGSNPPAPVKVAAANTEVAINPTTGSTTVAAVTGQTFSFATPVNLTGVKADGTSGTPVAVNSVKFGGTVAAPTFEMASSAGTITGNLSFGSCIFTAVSPAVVAGQKITVNPCTVTFATAGLKADGSQNTANGSLTLGTTSSGAVPVAIQISPEGTITVAGTVIQVTVPVVTGTGS